MTFKECMFSTEHDACTWLQHSLIAAAAVTFISLLFPGAEFLAACAATFGFMLRETQGPDRHLPWYRRLIASEDRVGDWLSPTITAWSLVGIYALLG